MLESAFVVLREAAELLLIVVAIHTFLLRAARPDAIQALWVGLAVGVGLGLTLVAAFVAQAWGPRVNAALSVGMGSAVMAMAIVMLSSRAAIDAHVGNLLEQALEGSGARWLVGGVAAFSAFRETTETGVFLLSAAQTHGWLNTLTGAIAGLGIAAVLAQAFRRRQPRLPLMAIYRVSTLLLCLLSIQLVLDGAFVLLDAPGTEVDRHTWAAALQAGTSEYYYLCTALMVPPLLLVARRWWREAGSLSA